METPPFEKFITQCPVADQPIVIYKGTNLRRPPVAALVRWILSHPNKLTSMFDLNCEPSLAIDGPACHKYFIAGQEIRFHPSGRIISFG